MSDIDYWWNVRSFVRFCMHVAYKGLLQLPAPRIIEFYEEVAAMAAYLDDVMTLMSAYNQLGKACKKEARYEKAIEYLHKLLRLAEMTQDETIQIRVYGDLVDVYTFTNNEQKAFQCFTKMRSLAADDKEIRAYIEYKVGEFHLRKGMYLEGIDHVMQSLEITREMKDRSWEAKLLMMLGETYIEMDEHEKAKQHLEDCLVVSLEIGDKDLEAEVYLQLGWSMSKSNDHVRISGAKRPNNVSQDIIAYYLKCLEVTPEDSPQKYDGYIALAKAYLEIESWEEFLKYSVLALEGARKIGFKEGEAIVSQSLATHYLDRGNLKKALEYCKNLELVKNLEKQQQVDLFLLSKYSCIYELTGENSKAIEYGEKALKLALELNDKASKETIYRSLAIAYAGKGEYVKSIEYHLCQLDIANDIGSTDSQINACSKIGTCYSRVGNHYKSFEWHKKALDISNKTSTNKHKSALYILMHCDLALSYQMLGQYHKAVELFINALEVARKEKNRCNEGQTLYCLGSALEQLDKKKEAEECFTKSLEIAVEIGDRRGEATGLGHSAGVKMNQGHYEEALELAEKQICISEEIENEGCLYSGYSRKGVIFTRLQKYSQAETCFEKALTVCQRAGNTQEEADTLYNLGELFLQKSIFHSRRGEWQERENANKNAIQLLQKALQCHEEVFENIQDQDHFKISILDTFIDCYSTLVVALIFDDRIQEALITSERGRARALHDQLTLKYGISKTRPSQCEPISFQAIQRMTSKSSFVFYHNFQTSIYFWLISQDSCKKSQLVRNSSLSNNVTNAYSFLNVRGATCEERLIQAEEYGKPVALFQARTTDVSEDLFSCKFKRCVYDEDAAHPLEGLYEQLIAPVLDELTEEDEIVIIPDGRPLYTVPFAALRDPTTASYLSETKRIRLAPSLTSLKLLQDSPADFHSKSGALVIGNPQVGEIIFRGKKIQVSDLPGAEREAKMIAEVLGVQPILGSQATKETIKDHLRQGVALVHFAAHGTHDGEIFLTPPPRGNQPQGRELPTPLPTILTDEPDPDYILTMKDVQESDVHPQLVVLSCCHSGRGEVKADGVIGMTRAFLAAGARAVVASLWAIDDDATMVFMEKFYSHLKQRKSASTSLHLAMRDMRGIPRYSEPRFWAPFFLIGDDVTLEI